MSAPWGSPMKAKRKLKIWNIVVLAYVLLLAGILLHDLTGRAGEEEPGLSPASQLEQLPPVDPVDPDIPDQAPAADPLASPQEEGPVLALTFDDGPSANVTSELVAALNERGAKATFFMLGVNAQAYPKLVQFVQESGHQVASHGWDHAHYLTDLNETQLAAELSQADEAIYAAIGEYPAYLRPPYGAMDRTTAARIDKPMMLWTIDPRDWEVRDSQAVCDHIVENAYDGGVVIAHDNYQTTLDGVICAVDILAQQGYRFVTLEEYYEIFDIQPQPGVVYRGTLLADIP